jgi:hypothetical protein
MRNAVYNSAIPRILSNTPSRPLCSVGCIFVQVLVLCLSHALTAGAADWSVPEQQLARKIVAITGPGAVAVTIENRSSLGQRDSEIVQNGLRSALEALGIRFVTNDQAAATLKISLSENLSSYIWVAEIRQGSGDSAVVMVSLPRPANSPSAPDSVPLTLREIPIWAQNNPILDVAVLEESSSPTHIAVLGPERVSLYRVHDGKWQQEQVLEIPHRNPWPRDLRGRLIPARDHLLDVYLPGAVCQTVGITALSCHESDDPWPLAPPTANTSSSSQTSAVRTVSGMKGFFAPTRNFFTGALTPGVGKFATVPKFYSAALLPRDKYTLWLFQGIDGQTHVIDGLRDQAAKLGWGSDITNVKTTCGAGWQVLAVSPGDSEEDSVRAYEFPDRDPVAVSPPVDFAGAITALWTEARGDTAIAVVLNKRTGSYEAFRLALACNQ